jgi:hypothetical protein
MCTAGKYGKIDANRPIRVRHKKSTGALRFKIAIVGGNRLFFLTHYWQNGEIEIGR